MENFIKRICMAQNELKCAKSQLNKFGGYKYRSCEDILEAAKPVCLKHGLMLNVTDKVESESGRIYVKAIATLFDTESDKSISSVGYARESESKKGMDDSQVTGTASSYARKYALNGLFCIDDTKDADTDEYTKQMKFVKEEVICAKCGKPIKPIKGKDGKIHSVEEVVKEMGGLCVDCYKGMKHGA